MNTNELARNIRVCFAEAEKLAEELSVTLNTLEPKPLTVGFAMVLFDDYLRDNFEEYEWDRIKTTCLDIYTAIKVGRDDDKRESNRPQRSEQSRNDQT